MASLDFSIPSEFKDQIQLVDHPEERSDGDLLQPLKAYQPITSERNVWAFWHSGLTSMPPWCQRNVIDWIRISGDSWIVRVLDAIPGSPNHFLNYVPAAMLNNALVEGKMDGDYAGQHSCDLLRGACLYLYGGCFMDVGCILIRDLDRICWSQLEDPDSPYQISTPWMYGLTIGNHFVASRKGDPFIKRWYARDSIPCLRADIRLT